MDSTMWIWIVIAILVIIVIIALLITVGSRRRREAKELQAKEDRERAVKLREDARVAELDSREKNAAAMRTASDAEQAAVAAERLSMEAEQQRSDASVAAAAAREKLAEAADVDHGAVDPGADASNRAQPSPAEDRTDLPSGEGAPEEGNDAVTGRHAAADSRPLHDGPEADQRQVRNSDGTIQGP